MAGIDEVFEMDERGRSSPPHSTGSVICSSMVWSGLATSSGSSTCTQEQFGILQQSSTALMVDSGRS